ncbi:MAG: hypothetical protein QG578_2046, partial [Thermodesulfobacteriota bacterium]|nr:hypothetical protein [Thermodesulfobacteriota bacterium]
MQHTYTVKSEQTQVIVNEFIRSVY